MTSDFNVSGNTYPHRIGGCENSNILSLWVSRAGNKNEVRRCYVKSVDSVPAKDYVEELISLVTVDLEKLEIVDQFCRPGCDTDLLVLIAKVSVALDEAKAAKTVGVS